MEKKKYLIIFTAFVSIWDKVAKKKKKTLQNTLNIIIIWRRVCEFNKAKH